MVDDQADAPRVAPGPIKGSGSRAPWIILALVVVAGLALVVSVLLAVLVLRS